jgi:hypothetical protein
MHINGPSGKLASERRFKSIFIKKKPRRNNYSAYKAKYCTVSPYQKTADEKQLNITEPQNIFFIKYPADK